MSFVVAVSRDFYVRLDKADFDQAARIAYADACKSLKNIYGVSELGDRYVIKVKFESYEFWDAEHEFMFLGDLLERVNCETP